MSNLIKSTVFGGPRHSAASFAVSGSEQKQRIADRALSERKNPQESQLATFAASTDARKMGYGALAFWMVVAALIAMRVAFLDPSRIQSASSLLGPNATSTWTKGESQSSKN